MVLKVCDSIMGSGKTLAAITLMNQETEYNYIFITPYLSEVERIQACCPNRNFVSPQNKGDGKLDNLHTLLRRKENVSTTHALFRTYTPYTMELIKNGNYKLILDEVFHVVERIEIKNSDLQILFDSNSISVDEDYKVHWQNDEYDGDKFWEIKQIANTGNLILYKNVFLYWIFPIEVFMAFQEVLLLTYLFDAQIQKYYYDMNGMTFSYIYTKKIENGIYQFTSEYSKSEHMQGLTEKIHILEDTKLNKIGNSNTALSSSWFSREIEKKQKPQIKTLKNNLVNLFTNKYKVGSTFKMWTTFKDHKDSLSGKRYASGFTSCNLRSTNEYRHKTHLAYCLNIYFHPHLKNYFLDYGVTVKEDEYALSEALQWLWRSAIRDGNEIWVYIPSKRMRKLLKEWLDSISKERKDGIHYE